MSVAPNRLRAADLDRSVWGTRFVGTPDFRNRCAQYQLRMPEYTFFSHQTAARIWGIPLPPGPESDLHIAVPDPARAPHAHGIAGHRLQIREDEVTTVQGLRVTTPTRTWLDLSSLDLGDLVAAGDFLIHHRHELTTLRALEHELHSRVTRRGLRRLWRALDLLNDRSESAPESILRVIIIEAGLPAPVVNHDVSDSWGNFVARTDLRIEEFRLVIEYMGDYHRNKAQWRADMTRRSRLESLGWRVMEVNADDLRDPAELARRIRDFARLPKMQP